MNSTLEFRWTVSRGRDSYGYNICSLFVDGRKVASCNGGGYDMKGTSLGNWIAKAYADRLCKLRPRQMPEQSHWERADPVPSICIQDGRGFYGLSFHDPDYDPGKAVIGKDCSDRTLARSAGKPQEGKTVAEAEAAGDSLGLERYQAFYSASSKTPDKRHRVPLIDGACGFSSVEKIMEAIGLRLEWINTRSKRQDLYKLHDKRAKQTA